MKPRRDTLDDEESLAGTNEPEAACLALERLRRARLREPMLELSLLGLQGLEVAAALGELVLRAQVAPEWARVQQSDQEDRADREPT